MSDLYTWDNQRDFNRANTAIKKSERLNSNASPTINRVSQVAIYAKITALVTTEVAEGEDADENDNKEAKGIEVCFDSTSFNFIEVTQDPVIYDFDAQDSASATVFNLSNISSKSAMAIDDIVRIEPYANLSESSDWLVLETGETTRSYVVITEASEDPANYVGNVIGGPFDLAVKSEGVDIVVLNATANLFAVGYATFADVTTDSNGVKKYVIDGFLLG